MAYFCWATHVRADVRFGWKADIRGSYVARRTKRRGVEAPSREELEGTRLHDGSYIFSAQYQQNPVPVEGNIVQREWLKNYENAPAHDKFRAVHVVCDPAGKAGPQNDYTAILVAGMIGRDVYVLEVRRGHWGMREIADQITKLVQQWKATQAIIETTGLGEAVREELNRGGRIDVRGIVPKDDKQTRLMRHIGRFECEHIYLPCEAGWLAEFVAEVLGFPSERYDDQLDALLLLLDDLVEHEPREGISFAFVPFGIPPDPYRYDQFSNRGYGYRKSNLGVMSLRNGIACDPHLVSQTP